MGADGDISRGFACIIGKKQVYCKWRALFALDSFVGMGGRPRRKGGIIMDCKFNTDLGLVTVNDDVIVRVAGYAALDCYGIVGMASKRGTDGFVQMMGRENLGRGVKIRSSGDKVDIDLFIIVEYGISISAVAAAIIETVKYKVEHLTGIPVGKVNVCVEDIRV